jgi:hypothetical protein
MHANRMLYAPDQRCLPNPTNAVSRQPPPRGGLGEERERSPKKPEEITKTRKKKVACFFPETNPLFLRVFVLSRLSFSSQAAS